MRLEVIGAGFGRTGTMSLKLALEVLGLGPCYHMMEVRKNPGHDRIWLDTIESESRRWDELFEHYRSACDWPQCHFWHELSQFYPSAKVILTIRDPERWYTSIKNTIFQALAEDPDPNDNDAVIHRTMTRRLIYQQTFGGRWQDKDHVLNVYRRHVEAVRRLLPKSRLLEYDVAEGWAPLCEFLDKPIPTVDFPRVNSTQEFKHRNTHRDKR